MKNLKETLKEIYSISELSPNYYNKTHFVKGRHSVYGEVTEESTNGIVEYFKKYFDNDCVFYDLGCGLGKMVVHIGLQYNIKKSCGIEFSKERVSCANYIKETYCNENNTISFIEGDFLKIDIGDAKVVYCDNTMYDEETTFNIIENLPKNCLFICRTPSFNKKYNYMISNKALNENFKTTYGSKKIFYLIK